MNLVAAVFIMVIAALTVRSSEPVPLASLCVLDGKGMCWINELEGKQREPQAGDYVISPEDLNRILEKLKAVQ